MFSNILREELKKLAIKYGEKDNVIKEITTEAVIFSINISQNKYGNFFRASYENILKNNAWKSRLEKPHTYFKKESEIKEVDSCNSSDALLMNIFCHPKLNSWKSIRNLLNISEFQTIDFGFKAEVLFRNGQADSTEVDLRINGNILGEAKLTEPDFTKKEKNIVESYDNFEKVFNKKLLIQDREHYMNYQLIRNILAAEQYSSMFYLICDGRRPDLIREFYYTVRCVKNNDLRNKCEIIYFQEIANSIGNDLKIFLKEKYGL